jgi:hypothetical protein
MFRRDRFGEVIGRQFDVFEADQADLLDEVADLFEKWNAADRDEAEEAYGYYADAIDAGAELLAAMRDRFAATLAEQDTEQYEREFNRAAGRRFPVLGRELESR